MVKFSEVKLNRSRTPLANLKVEHPREYADKDIAIIGISVKLPTANHLDEYWQLLQQGKDCIGPLTGDRVKDTDRMVKGLKMDHHEGQSYAEAAYIDHIDKFDYSYFRISPKEAALMDPNQRLFLETAWLTIEDAGYGGSKIKGTRTGVYVGYGSDTEYKRWIAENDPSLLSVALAGNTRPIIASRLSYLLDLRGPSLIVDTTCSSSLMAVHLACRSLRDGDSDMAIAGGVQIHLLPIRQTAIGVEAGDHRAKTFDERADGTGTGEGVGAVLLKPLKQAMKDGDHIYAVIKGSAINHDGSSIGLTAPNAVAQADVIINAWKDAQVDPESITYIEAHGTGTKLGDPIEIEGINSAFRQFTNKRNFCALGSVKTNIGHLDNSAGIAGLIKSVLALKHRKLPPSLNFIDPNRKIDFINSPVYVNDKLSTWETGAVVPRRCGVSAFGLSGTNCHVILEEAPASDSLPLDAETSKQVLTISAKSYDALLVLIQRYRTWLRSGAKASLREICYTANTGRGHYTHRLVIVFQSRIELQEHLDALTNHSLNEITREGIYFGKHQIVSANQPTRNEGDLTEHAIKSLSQWMDQMLDEHIQKGQTNEANLIDICRAYTEGASVDWAKLYRYEQNNKVSLPTYPFELTRCWYDGYKPMLGDAGRGVFSALIDKQIVDSIELDIYTTALNTAQNWVLSEHRIMNESVLVGTAYLEMVLEVCANKFPDQAVEFKDVLFQAPLIVRDGETVEAQLIIKKTAKHFEFSVESRLSAPTKGEQLTRHVTGNFNTVPQTNHFNYNREVIIKRLESGYMLPDLQQYNEDSVFEFGPRWNNIHSMYVGEEELFSVLRMPAKFTSELGAFTLYPSLMDNALTTMPIIQKAISVDSITDDSIYLPFSYKSIIVYHALPAELYSYVRLKETITKDTEIIHYDITLMDGSGKVIVEIEDYALKKARKAKLQAADQSEGQMYYQMGWIPQEASVEPEQDANLGTVLVIGSCNEAGNKLAAVISEHAQKPILTHSVEGDQPTIEQLADLVKEHNVTRIVHLAGYGEPTQVEESTMFEQQLYSGVNSVFNLIKELLSQNIRHDLEISLVASHTFRVTGDEAQIVPEHAALFGLGKVIAQEYPNFKCRQIDADTSTSHHLIVQELMNHQTANDQVAFRSNLRFIQEFQELTLTVSEEVVKPGGTYVITGGIGGIGLEIAKYLAAKQQVKLALISRGSMPDKDLWEEILAKGTETKWCRAIVAIQKIEATGTPVICVSADVSHRGELEHALEDIRQQFGAISGVVHSAGVAGDGYIIKKELAQFHAVLAPKVEGTRYLDELTAADKLDFFALFSSNTTLIGVPGQSDYTAANSYLDAYAAYRNQKGSRTFVINWPAWKETGMAADYGTNQDNLLKALPTAQAIQAFDTILNTSAERVLVGELNIHGSYQGYSLSDVPIHFSDNIRRRFAKPRQRNKGSVKRTSTNESVLKGKESVNSSDMEVTIAGIWQEVLGFEEINVYDNFFEIGGDSILITRIYALLEQQFPGMVSVADLFSYTSISSITQYILQNHQLIQPAKEAAAANENMQAGVIDDSIDELLNAFEKGSINIVQAMESFNKLGVST